jgi:hypothetical protein
LSIRIGIISKMLEIKFKASLGLCNKAIVWLCQYYANVKSFIKCKGHDANEGSCHFNNFCVLINQVVNNLSINSEVTKNFDNISDAEWENGNYSPVFLHY